ncbi:MAG: rod shape-determining protein MreD [Candidatus Eremiobacteraeota bacterium]|nr:rod shape-determining protein MreD [Candidatus Eremiobacteraeota bacterium]
MSSSRGKPHVAPFVGPPWHVAAAWLLLAVLAQATVVHYVAIRGVVPSLVLVVVVWYAVRVDVRRAALFGLAAGLCEDVLAGSTGGAWTIATIATALLASVLSRGFFADSIPLAAAVTVIAALLRALLFWTVMSFEGYPPGLGTMHAREALLAAALNVVVMIAAMVLARRFDVRTA